MLGKRFWERNREEETTIGRVILLPVAAISPNSGQPRRNFPEEGLRELARSIEENGLLQPITVRPLGEGKYELIAGERRLRAFRLLGRSQIPGIVEERDDLSSHSLALIENLQRDDLNFFEQAMAIRALMEAHRLSQAEAARRIGMAQSTVANKLRLLKLDEEIQEQVASCGFTERHARCLLLLPTKELQQTAVREIARRSMNVAQAEAYVRRLLETDKPETPKQSRRFVPKDVRIFLNTINRAIETMKSAGIDALAEQDEDEECFRYTVRIPKTASANGRAIPGVRQQKTG